MSAATWGLSLLARAVVDYVVDRWVGRDGAWIRLLQDRSGRPVGIDLDLAERLLASGLGDHFVGEVSVPDSLCLVAKCSDSVPIELAISDQLIAPCADAMGQNVPPIFPLGGVVPRDPFAPRGSVIGSYMGMHIHDSLTLQGREYGYDRIAVEHRGAVPLEQLLDGEMVVAPGLIYRPRPS